MLTLATGGFAGSNGKHIATEVARLLAELNDIVEGVADTKILAAVLDTNPQPPSSSTSRGRSLRWLSSRVLQP